MRVKELFNILYEDFHFHSNNGNKIISLLFDSRLSMLRLYRYTQFFNSTLLSPFNVLINKIMLSRYSSQIAISAKIGRKVKFAHPLGIVIGHSVVIKDNCIIYQNVTLGAKGAN